MIKIKDSLLSIEPPQGWTSKSKWFEDDLADLFRIVLDSPDNDIHITFDHFEYSFNFTPDESVQNAAYRHFDIALEYNELAFIDLGNEQGFYYHILYGEPRDGIKPGAICIGTIDDGLGEFVDVVVIVKDSIIMEDTIMNTLLPSIILDNSTE